MGSVLKLYVDDISGPFKFPLVCLLSSQLFFFFFPCTNSLSPLFDSKGSEDLNHSCQAYSLLETIHVLCGLALCNSSLSNPFPGGCA